MVRSINDFVAIRGWFSLRYLREIVGISQLNDVGVAKIFEILDLALYSGTHIQSVYTVDRDTTLPARPQVVNRRKKHCSQGFTHELQCDLYVCQSM